MEETPSSDILSPKLKGIAKLSKEAPEMRFTSLGHHLDIDWLKEAYRVRKDGAPGVEG